MTGFTELLQNLFIEKDEAQHRFIGLLRSHQRYILTETCTIQEISADEYSALRLHRI